MSITDVIMPTHAKVAQQLAQPELLPCKGATPVADQYYLLYTEEWVGFWAIGLYREGRWVNTGGYKFHVQPTHYGPLPPRPLTITV